MQPQLLLVTLLSLTFASTTTAAPIPTALSYRDLTVLSHIVSHVRAAVPAIMAGSYTERTLAALAEERCGELVVGKNCA